MNTKVAFSTVLLMMFGACATQQLKGAEYVKIVDPTEVSKMGDCSRVGAIRAVTSEFFVANSTNDTQQELLKQLRNEAVRARANVVVTRQQMGREVGFSTGKDAMKGVAYSCDGFTIQQLTDSGDF